MRNYLILFLASLFLCSCGEYQRVLKSDDRSEEHTSELQSQR